MFPWSTLGVNLTGCALLGWLLTRLNHPTGSPPRRSVWLRPLLTSGFCGAFTTFSAVTASSALLLLHRQVALGLGYLASSFGGGLLAALLGRYAARSRSGQAGPDAATMR